MTGDQIKQVASAIGAAPITATEAADFCRCDSSEISAYILPAISAIEADTRFDILTKTITATIPAAALRIESGRYWVRFSRGPVSGVTSLRTFDDPTDTVTVYDNSNAIFSDDCISFPYDKIAEGIQDYLEIVFSVGSAEIPGGIRLAALQMISHLYAMRVPVITGATATEIPYTVEYLTNPYRFITA